MKIPFLHSKSISFLCNGYILAAIKNIFPNNEKYKIDINIIGYTIEIIVNDIIVEKGQIDDNYIHRS